MDKTLHIIRFITVHAALIASVIGITYAPNYNSLAGLIAATVIYVMHQLSSVATRKLDRDLHSEIGDQIAVHRSNINDAINTLTKGVNDVSRKVGELQAGQVATLKNAGFPMENPFQPPRF